MKTKLPKKPIAPKPPLKTMPKRIWIIDDYDFEGTLQDLIDMVPEGISYSEVRVAVEGQNCNGADFEMFYDTKVENPNLKEETYEYQSKLGSYNNKMTAYKAQMIKYNEEHVKELEKEIKELKK